MIVELEFKLIVGTIHFKDIETGYWVINDGEMEYRIVDIPQEIKTKGIKLAAIAQLLEAEDSIYITSLNIKILEFKILK